MHRPSRPARVAGTPRLPDRPPELLPAPGYAPAFQLEPAPSSPRAACLRAARRAERIHGLPEGLLVAVALSESGLHAHALNIAGRSYFPDTAAEARALLARARGSAMAGCVQVNAGVHARNADWPLDAERSADWAGGLLRRWQVETGSWTQALARWHGGSPASTRRVLCRVRAKLEVTSPGSPVLADAGCAGTMARERRNGEALLSVAETADR
ncbi:transglycosylase [Paracraurococcus ruber]|uniref:transglycosylase n=1 Tax=Paracraurococcus ruber TaxID=77675 RepID=UPI001F0163C5|nr:transglycosylase [Paracraurococcus ruber]